MVDNTGRRGTTPVYDHRVGREPSDLRGAYRQIVLSFERRPGALGARWRGFPEGLSDPEGYALLMEYLRRQRAQKATGPQARTPPVANAGQGPTGAGFLSVFEATSYSSTTGPLVGLGAA